MRHPDRSYSDRFWQELVFNQHDDPGTLREQAAWRLRRHPNVYVQMVNERGRVVFRDSERDYIVRAVPSIGRSITGARYTGRVEVGHTVRGDRAGWVKVEVVDHHEAASERTCGLAWVGADAGHIWIIAGRRCDFAALFAHELGHSYGLRHVGHVGSLMYPSQQGARWFSGLEQYHSQLVYRDVQRAEKYCGWPHGPACALRKVLPSGLHGPRILAID